MRTPMSPHITPLGLPGRKGHGGPEKASGGGGSWSCADSDLARSHLDRSVSLWSHCVTFGLFSQGLRRKRERDQRTLLDHTSRWC